MPDPTTFAGLLCEWRGNRSAAECGRVLGKSSQTILDWCNGVSVPPRPARPAIAALMGVTLDRLTAAIELQRPTPGIRIDTVPQAREWVDTHSQPTPAAQGG
jgi:hypothetical protein